VRVGDGWSKGREGDGVATKRVSVGDSTVASVGERRVRSYLRRGEASCGSGMA